MEFGGRKTDEGSSVEEERSDAKKKGSSAYYECNFCKRGFTNAQALGGHMNIHRKDKSKAPPKKPKSKQALNPNKAQNLPQIIPLPCASNVYNSYMFYHSCPLPYASSPNHPKDHLGFDLSLQIGPSMAHDEEINDGGTVDLELRLGRPSPP